MADTGTANYTTDELLERANAGQSGTPLTARTLRYYASLQLIDAPITRQGQAARYTDRHLHQLEFVRTRRAAGRGLAEIAAELRTGGAPVGDAPAADTVPVGLALPGPSGMIERPRPWPMQPQASDAQVLQLAPGVQVVLTGAAIGDHGLIARLAAAAAPSHRPHPLNGDARA